MKTEFADITGYYDDSRAQPDDYQVRTLAEIFDMEEAPAVRWPVLNSEPREPISSQKRAIIHERDGKICRYCGTSDELLVLDHIIPRSAFPAHQLRIADRSDNLHSACWDCNQKRSNFEAVHIKRLGVVVRCWYCVNRDHSESDEAFLPYPVDKPVFCGQCGVSHVPAIEGWVL